MALFIQTGTPVITYRKHLYNSEYLDGRLEPIEDNAICFIIRHVANTSFGYDISIYDELLAIVGWGEMENLNRFNRNDPAKTFFELILKSGYDEYKSDTKFTEVTRTIENNPVEKTKKTRTNNITKPEKKRFDIPSLTVKDPKKVSKPKKSETPPASKLVLKKVKSGRGKFTERPLHLVRNSETPIYIYKSPGSRF